MRKMIIFGLVLVMLSMVANAITYKDFTPQILNENTIIYSENITEDLVASSDLSNFTYEIISEDASEVNCEIENDDDLVFYPNILFEGTASCILNGTTNISATKEFNIEVYDESNLTISGDQPQYSGGSPSTEENIIVVDVVNNTVESVYTELVETFFGEKVIVSKGDKLFEMFTDANSDYFQVYMRAGETKIRKLFIRNNGLGYLELKVSCEGAFCDNIEFDKQNVELEPNPDLIQPVFITMRMPDNVQEGNEFVFNIVVSEATDPELRGFVSGKATVNNLLAWLSSRISASNLIDDGITVYGIMISNIYLALAGSIIFFIFVTSMINISGTESIFYRFIQWLGSLIVFIIIIAFI